MLFINNPKHRNLYFSFSIVAQPGLDQPPIIIRNPNQRDYLIGGLKPNTKYRVQVRASTIAGLSTSPAMIELTTNYSLSKILECRIYLCDYKFFSTFETIIQSYVSRINFL